MSLDQALLIEIYTAANREGRFQKIGTGYPVGPGRILTARHVLGAGASAGIKARWHNQDGPAREWREAKIVWEDAGLDVAVLAWDAPDGLKNKYGRIRIWEPKPHHPWNSLGFAKCGHEEDKDKLKTKATSLQGTCSQRHSADDTFDINVVGATALPDGWQGVSGCPVFVDGSIVGVVVQCPAEFNQERLLAVSGRNFFNDPEFKKAIQLPADNPHRTRVRNAMIDALTQHDWLRDIVSATEGGEIRPDALADRLLNKELRDFLFGFHCVCRTEEEKPDGAAHLSVISRVVLLTIPVLVDSSSLADERTEIATRTSAEIAMANHDKRDTNFSLSGREPVGKYAVPVPPPGGFEEINGKFSSQFAEHLFNQSAPGDIKNSDEQEAHQIICEFLKEKSALRESRYYSVDPRIVKDESLFRATIEFLSSRYEGLRLIQLSKGREHFVAQTAISRHVTYFLSLAAGSPQ